MKLALAASFLVVAVAAGCGGDSEESADGGTGGAIAGGWVVTGLHSGSSFVDPIAATEITAVFLEDGRLSGSAGCNGYSTAYTTDGASITIEPAAATKKFCGEPEGLMDQEAAYLTALGEAAEYSVDGSTLELLDGAGSQLVTFEGAES